MMAFARAASQAARTGSLLGPLAAQSLLVPTGIAEVAGCALGLTLAGYSGVLLAATNIPLWAKSKLLGGLFMASALASGSAAVSPQAPRRGVADATLHRLVLVGARGAPRVHHIPAAPFGPVARAPRPLTHGRRAAP